MSFSYVGNASGVATAGTEIDCNRPAGVAVGNIIIFVVAFEGVAAGSGPWIIPNTGQFSTLYIGPSLGWQQLCWQTPSAAGVGIEVWGAIHGTGTVNDAKFAAAQNAVGVAVAYSGEYNPTGTISGGPPRVATTAQVSGNQPAAPAVVANVGELIVACGGDTMGGSGFGAPAGFTNRIDVARAGAGTVEATIADATATVAGNTGPITFPNAASGAAVKGATATLLIQPVPATPTNGGVIDAPLPENLIVGEGYSVRVTAIDPTTGALVSGVTIGKTVLTAESEDMGGDTSGGDLGTWQLVPGPNA